MGIDKQYTAPMLSIYKNWLEQNKAQLSDNENYNEVGRLVSYTEELAEKHTDISEFFTQLNKEQVLIKLSKLISTNVGKMIDKNIKNSQNIDDNNVIENFIKQYEESLAQLTKLNYDDKNTSTHHLHKIMPVINALEQNIALAKTPGITSPKIFATQIEKGLDRALEGKLMYLENFLFHRDLALATMTSPYEKEIAERKLELYENLANQTALHIPNSKILDLELESIDLKFENSIIFWTNIVDKINEILLNLELWILSFCNFATQIPPWSLAENPNKKVLQTQETNPIELQRKMQVINKYFHLTLKLLMNHEVMDWRVKHNLMENSQIFTEYLVSEIYPLCITNQKPPIATVKKMENLYLNKMCLNPKLNDNLLKINDLNMKYFPNIEQTKIDTVETNAELWKFDTWKETVNHLPDSIVSPTI